MSIVNRIGRRFFKEESEREAEYTKGAPEREKRYKKIEELLRQYDEIRREHPYEMHEDARHIHNHVTDEYGFDLVWFFRRVREGKQP